MKMDFDALKKRNAMALHDLKEQGKHVVGMFCTYSPKELIYAAGAVPVGLCAYDESPIDAAHAELPRNLCPLIKASYGYAVTKKCPYMNASDLVIGETTCDGKKKMYELLAKHKDVHVLQLPNMTGGKSLELFTDELRKFRKVLEQKFNTKITDEALLDAVQIYNEERDVMLELLELGKLNPMPVAGSEIHQISFASDFQGCELRQRAKFDEFVLGEDGGVDGVIIREDYKFDPKSQKDDAENTTGTKKTIKAKKGVVLAAGGFCRDVFFRQVQDPSILPTTDSTNHPGATAGAMKEAFRIGATPVQLSWIQFGPWACPDEKGFGVGSMFNVNGSFRYGISVDPRTGKRYMNELADRRTRSQAMFKVIDAKADIYPINFCDSEGVKNMVIPEHYTKPLESGVLKKFETLDELAAFYKIPAAELKKTVERYNSFVKSGKDEDFGKPMDKTTTNGVDISKPPFYAMRGTPKLHHTMGGIDINTKAQVISLQTEMPIPRLFAAGEITGGVHGASRLGSVAIADCLTFGMIAGENIG